MLMCRVVAFGVLVPVFKKETALVNVKKYKLFTKMTSTQSRGFIITTQSKSSVLEGGLSAMLSSSGEDNLLTVDVHYNGIL
ncbi:hypothetical protein L1887_13110 [Cichorium endivia]|nr:hypothetical protein L1887_13110 [Cichorium endivia]